MFINDQILSVVRDKQDKDHLLQTVDERRVGMGTSNLEYHAGQDCK